MSIEKAKILPNMHFNTPNPEINFQNLKIKVPTELTDWKSGTGVRRASVNSFGYGGQNAHVILENYRPAIGAAKQRSTQIQPENVDKRPFLIPLTSHTEKAGKLLVTSTSEFIQQKPDLKVHDLAYSLSVKRSMHQCRSFAIGHDQLSVLEDLAEPKATAKWNRILQSSPKVGFVFTGQGAQWHAMGRQLIEQSRLFKQTLERCDASLQRLPDSPDWSCIDELCKPPEDSRLSQSRFSQPICAGLQLGIVELLRAWGITPSAVVGHSSGEIVAAYCAGVLSFESTIICAYYRGLYMSKGVGIAASARGAMMAVGLTETEGKAELKAYKDRICLAAINSPSSLTFSGDEDAILELKQELERRKIFARRLKVEQAFHSHHMQPLAPAFEQALSRAVNFQCRSAKIRFCSSVTARDSSARKMNAEYWATNMTGTVMFSDALTGILLNENDEQDIDVLVEIGAHPALRAPSNEILNYLKLKIPYFASLTRETPAFESLLATAGQLFSLGYPVDLAAVNSNFSVEADGRFSQTTIGRKLQDIPSYRWDHGKYWAETRQIREQRFRKNRHSLLGFPTPGGLDRHPRWRNYLRQSEIPWLSQHAVDGKTIFPAAGYISMAIEAITNLSPAFKNIRLRDVVFKAILTLSSSDVGTEVITELQPVATSAKSTSSTWFRFVICSFDEKYKSFEHCHGLICTEQGDAVPVRTMDETSGGFAQLQKATNRSRSRLPYYGQLQKMGLMYGENFQLLSGDIESGAGFAIAPLTFRPVDVVATPADACILHPTCLDAAFHVIFAAIETTQNGRPLDEAFVPTFVRSMTVSGLLSSKKYETEDQKFWVKSETKLPGSRVAINRLSMQSGRSNDVLVDMQGFEVTALGNGSDIEESKRSLFFRIRWLPAFDTLGRCGYVPSFKSIGDVMDVFAHQFPNAEILHLTPDVDATRELLRFLGGSEGERRRFGKITPHSRSSSLGSRKECVASWGSLVSFEEPKDYNYDVVVISEPVDYDITSFLKPNGFVVTDNNTWDSQALPEVFKDGAFSSYQNSASVQASEEDLTLLVSTTCTATTQAILSAIKDLYKGTVRTMTITDVAKVPLSSRNIISLVGLDENPFFEATAEKIMFDAVQKLLQRSSSTILWLLKGATGESPNPAQAMILGLARTVRSENEDLRFVTLDLPQDHDITSTSRFAVEVLNGPLTEDEFAVRNGLLVIPRVEVDDRLNRKLPNGGHRQPRLEPFKQDRNLALKIGKVGLLDTLVFEDDEDTMEPQVGDDDVEVEVKASALNFRDLAASIGIIDDYRLGDECSGIITRTGRNVNAADFRPGDRVLACMPGQGAHRSIVRNPALLCHKIGSMDFVTATSFEGVLTTAYYSLIDTARLQKGEYCLIHAAAGGVGQMAVQLAQMMGAHVIATVGSQSKRDFLKAKFSLTDDMIFSSRDPSFVDGVLKVTNGRGCDVALNSLAGELLHATWSCMAPFGRLIEIGKRDIHENTKLDMDPFRRNITYASVDLITLYNLNKELMSRVIHDCYKLVEDGKIQIPGPITEVSYAEVQKGFRLLQMGKHFGKVVLVPGDNDLVPVLPASYRNGNLFESHKTYLLVGGLGGIGRTLAEWMFRKGARKLAFLSRSGAKRTDAKATVNWLKTRNVHVSVFAGDVADSNVVEQCVRSLGSSLAGIFQAAMVLRDTLFADMTFDQWQDCVTPKVRGTHNLHKATLNRNLDFFVCFSSGAVILGSKGQANYAAANAYLDALMNHRRRLGLAGTTMNVGAVGGIGAVAENSDLQRTMERLGYELISEDELFYQIEEAVSTPNLLEMESRGFDDHQIITGINMRTKDLYWSTKPIFRNLYSNLDLGVSATGSSGAVSLTVSLLNTTDTQERITILMAAFIEKVANVLAVPASTIQAGNPLSAYGLDSIVAVEFRKWFSNTVMVEMALFDILGAKSIEALITKAISEMALVAAEDVSDTSKMTRKNASPLETSGGARVKKSLAEELKGVRKPAKIPMSTFQRRIWFLHNVLEHPSSLNFVITAQFKGHPDMLLLQRTFTELSRRNDILRTCYYEGDEFSEQAVLEEVHAQVQFVDLSSDSLPDLTLQKYIRETRNVAMQIESGEVIKFALVKLAEARYTAVLVCHHIALDNGSTISFMEQFTALYDALVQEKSLSLVATPKITYSEFTLWYQDNMQSEHLKRDMRWWAENFNGSLGVSRLLPFAKFQRPLKRSSTRSILKSTLDLSLLKRLKRICARMNATPFQFLLTAFRAFIYRYTQEDDLTILMIDGNRPHADLGDILGFFVNMIPLRCHNTCDTSFEDLVGDTKQTVLDGLAHSQVPFDSIVEAVKAEVNPSHFPIGQVAFNYQMYGKPPRYKTQHFTIEDVLVEDIPTACEMQLEALEDPQSGIKLRFEYDSFLYEAGDMERFFENFSMFVTSVVRDYRQPVEEIEICGPKELDYLRSECWRVDVKENVWDDQSVIDKITEVAERHPGKTAIMTSDGETISYAMLLNKAQRIASSLRDAGMSRGQFVGIMCHPGIPMVAAMMGAVYAGCAYVPLDPKFAKGRLNHMIEDSSASIILTGEGIDGLAEEITRFKEHPARFSSIASAAGVTDLMTSPSATAEDAFYVIYTSVSIPKIRFLIITDELLQGSTGKPKGVILSHSNTQAMLSSHNEAHAFNAQDNILFHSSMSFDLSVVQIWGSLTSGATMALASQETRQDPVKLSRFMRDAAVTITYFPATQFALLLEHNVEDLRKCISYRRALFAGEYLPVRLVKAIYDLKTPVTVFNQWGPTETTVQTTSHQASYPGPAELNLPIGHPIANCSHYVVDRQLRPVPASVIGELCIGGVQVSRGYRNRPAVTEEVFVSDPFASETFHARGWSKLYRTGDRGCFLPDGQIVFKGRISGDKQIKLRGHRLDLAEIENEIHLASQHLEGQKLVDVAVLLRSTSDDEAAMTDNRQLIAFIVPSRVCTPSEQKMLVNSLHQTISMVLNDVMLPSAYQFMNTLSTLVSGKIDRQMLLKTDLNLIFPSSAIGPSEHGGHGDEETLFSVVLAFKHVLKIPHERELLPTESFFDLGGQSILLLRLRATLKRKFGVDIPLAKLFEHPTPISIASRVLGYANDEDQQKPGTNASIAAPDWAAEATLPSTDQYNLRPSVTPTRRSDITDLLVTGVDSFVGIHMLAKLISAFPSAIIHALGSQVKLIPFDIQASFEQWHLFNETITSEKVESQVRCVPGTLSLARFGLDDQSFQELGRSVQSIYHIGGHVSLLKTYSDLKRLNVGSTLDVIELAKLGSHRTEIHYLSTWSVPHLQSWKNSQRENRSIDITETSPAQYQPGGGEELGYFKSRWVAEMLLNEAANRGFPVTIYRSSAVTSNINSNLATPEDNLTQNMMLSMIEAGSVPDLETRSPEFAIDFIPIDYLASVMTHLSSSDVVGPPEGIAYYHIGNPSPLKLRDLPAIITQIRDDGVKGSVVPLSEWVTSLASAASGGGGGDDETSQLEKTVLKQFLDLGHTMFSLDGARTKAALKKTGSVVECPAVDEKYLGRLFRDRH